MACCERSFLQAQKNWFCPLLFKDLRKLHPTMPEKVIIRVVRADSGIYERGVVRHWSALRRQWGGGRAITRASGASSEKGPEPCPPLPHICFLFFSLKYHLQHSCDLETVVKAWYKIWGLFHIYYLFITWQAVEWWKWYNFVKKKNNVNYYFRKNQTK